MYFIQETKERLENALSSWKWIGLPDYCDYRITIFGDAFLFVPSGQIYFLDSLEGSCNIGFNSPSELKECLSTAEGKDKFFLAGLADRACAEGMILSSGECYDWRLNPAVGGKIEFKTMQVMDFVVSLNIAGQIHDQVRKFPPGTKISSFKVTDG